MRTTVNDDSIVNWRSATGQLPSDGCLAFGRLWVALGSSVISFDAVSGAAGQRISGFGSNADPRFLQPYGDLLAVACDDQRLYTLDPDTGEIQGLAYVGDLNWMAPYQGSLFVAGTRGVYRVARPDENIHTPYGPLVGPYGEGNLGGDPAIADGVIYVPLGNNVRRVAALDAMTLDRLWEAEADGAVGAAHCDGSTLAFATWNRTVYFYDVGSRARINQFSSTGELAGAPIVAGDRAYLAATSGIVEAVDYRAGRPVGSYQLPSEPIGTGILNENGVLFYRASSQILAIDTSAGPASGVQTYATGSGPVIADYAQGALFFADRDNASAVRLDEQIHEFYAESHLIRDFDFQASVDDPASTPNFQVQIGLFKEDGSPRAGQTVRITATVPTEILYQGQRLPVSRDRYVDVTTDGVGRFRIGVPAGAVDDAGDFQEGLSAPELLLASPFMDPAMRFVVRPNGQLQDNLGTIDQNQLAGAKGYDDAYVVTDEYRNDPTALGHATSAINETAGMVRGSMSEPRKRDAGNRYCDPACDMAVACCMPAGDPGGRVVCDQPYSFDIRIGTSHFRRLSAAEARTAAMGLTGSAPESWIGDFWDDIKTGAAKVVGAVVESVEDGVRAAVKAIKDGIEHAIDIVIDTIEKAVLFVQGVFNAIATAIKRVIEAVSFLFDWRAILDLHDQIRDQVNGAWDSLVNGTDGVSFDTIKAALDGALDTAKEQADHAFDAAKAALGVRSPLSAQSEATGEPNAVVGTGQNDWLLNKFKDNAIPEDGPRARGATAAAAVSWPDFDPGQAVSQAFDSFLAQLGDSVGSDVKATLDRIRDDLDFQSSPGILARGFAVVIDIVRGLTDIAIDLTKAVGDLAIDLLKAVLNALRSFVNAKIEIPYVTDFYRWATGNDLTLLDLMSLLVAIPTGFALKLASREPAYASGVSPDRPTALRAAAPLPTIPPKGWIEVAAGVSQIVWGIVNGIVSGLDLRQRLQYGPLPGSGLSRIAKARLAVTGAALILVRGTFAAAIFVGKKPDALALAMIVWAIPSFVMLFDVLFIWLSGGNPDTSLLGVTLGALLGVVMGILAIVTVLEGSGASQWLGFGFAVAVALSLVTRIAVAVDDPKVKYAGIAATGLLLVVSGGIEIARGGVEPGAA